MNVEHQYPLRAAEFVECPTSIKVWGNQAQVAEPAQFLDLERG